MLIFQFPKRDGNILKFYENFKERPGKILVFNTMEK